MLKKEDVETAANLIGILHDDCKAVIRDVDRVRDLLGEVGLVDIEYNRLLDCLDFIIDDDDPNDEYVGRRKIVHGGTELLEIIRENTAE